MNEDTSIKFQCRSQNKQKNTDDQKKTEHYKRLEESSHILSFEEDLYQEVLKNDFSPVE